MYFLIKFRVRLLIFKGEEILNIYLKDFFFVMFRIYWISNICNEKKILLGRIKDWRVFKNVLFFD